MKDKEQRQPRKNTELKEKDWVGCLETTRIRRNSVNFSSYETRSEHENKWRHQHTCQCPAPLERGWKQVIGRMGRPHSGSYREVGRTGLNNKMPKSIFLKTLITGRQQQSQSSWGNPASVSVLGKEVIRRLINFPFSSLIMVSGCA